MEREELIRIWRNIRVETRGSLEMGIGSSSVAQDNCDV